MDLLCPLATVAFFTGREIKASTSLFGLSLEPLLAALLYGVQIQILQILTLQHSDLLFQFPVPSPSVEVFNRMFP